jgi:hypothetical protein
LYYVFHVYEYVCMYVCVYVCMYVCKTNKRECHPRYLMSESRLCKQVAQR